MLHCLSEGYLGMNDSERLSLDFGYQICKQNTYHGIVLEAGKGANSTISRYRIDLEPRFAKFYLNNIFFSTNKTPRLVTRVTKPEYGFKLARFFYPLKEKMDWKSCEEVTRSLSGIKDKKSFEIIGNKAGVKFFVGSPLSELNVSIVDCWRSYLPEISCADFPDPIIELVESDDLWFLELYLPPPNYWKVSECYDFANNPLIRLASIFAKVNPPYFGFYHVISQPVRNDWAGNMKQLLEGEAILGKHSPFGRSSSNQIKAFSTEPLFVVKIRVGGNFTESWFKSAIEMFVGIFKCGGHNLLYHTIDDFKKVLSRNQINSMLIERSSYCSSMFLSSSELTSFVSLVDSSVRDHSEIKGDFVQGFPVPDELRGSGVPLGINTYQGNASVVHVPFGSGGF